jgi:hypothetical protein
MSKHIFRNKPFAKMKIDKRSLSKFVKQNKGNKWIAKHFKASQRTISRRINEYGLKGIRKRGRKPFLRLKKPIKIRFKRWALTRNYIDSLNSLYHFLNIQYPPTKYVSTYTLVCSDRQANPKGKFTTCSVYYVALQSEAYFLYTIQYRYSETGVSFNEIYHYFSNNAMDMLRLSLERTDIEIIDLTAFHFTLKSSLPQPVVAYAKSLPQRKASHG